MCVHWRYHEIRTSFNTDNDLLPCKMLHEFKIIHVSVYKSPKIYSVIWKFSHIIHNEVWNRNKKKMYATNKYYMSWLFMNFILLSYFPKKFWILLTHCKRNDTDSLSCKLRLVIASQHTCTTKNNTQKRDGFEVPTNDKHSF